MSNDYMNNYMKERRKARRQKFIQMLGGACSNCGSKDNLQFDHANAKNKKYDLNKIKDGNEKTILKELKKCVLLCPECHIEKTRVSNDNLGADKKPARHGTVHMYKNHGCRCNKCREAVSQYLKNRKLK